MVRHVTASAAGSEVARIIRADGCVVIDDLVAPEVMDQLLNEMAPHIDASPKGTDRFTGFRTTRTGGLIARSETARDLVRHPKVLEIVTNVLDHAKNYQLHLTQIISIGAGQEAQDIHRDQWAFDFFPFPQGYEVQCNLMWAGCEFTEEIGATRVVRGSHMEPDSFKAETGDTEAATMSKGSVLIYSGALFHGGGANLTTDETRQGINIAYGVGWVRQEENQYLTVPREIAETLDEPLLRLMGYARGAYALGYIDDLRDPIEAVRPDLGKTGFGDSTALTT